MARQRKSWVEKRYLNRQPEVKVLQKAFADIPAGATMLIPTPQMVQEYLEHLATGQQGSLSQMRADLAASNGVQFTCPVTSGIFLRIVAEAAYEEFTLGKPLAEIAPFWRLINGKSPTAKKLSFGVEFLLNQRRAEGLL
ncbi:MAG TPA: hypothetical protein PKD90_02685 [Phnomibacter sp.]|nr:hypothetical protein [Phnomibacter sp.]